MSRKGGFNPKQSIIEKCANLIANEMRACNGRSRLTAHSYKMFEGVSDGIEKRVKEIISKEAE